MDLEVAVDTGFHFLRLPAEIRLDIYRYLFLGRKLVTLNPPWRERYKIHDGEDGIVSINQYDRHHYLSIDPSNETYLNLNHLPAVSVPQVLTQHEDNLKRVKCHTAILRTNRQIYHEASALLYSTLVMQIKPGDVMFSDTWVDVVEPGKNIWRSFPRRPGVKNHPVEKVGYKRYNHLHGTMQPTSFAKFERIAFVVMLDFTALDNDFDIKWPRLVVDNEFHISREDERIFKACLNGEGRTHPPVTDIFRQFVDVLMKSSYISHLEISFGVMVNVGFDFGSEDSEDEEDEDSRKRREQKEEWMLDCADESAAEFALEVGVLDPLKRLSNVRQLALSFTWRYPQPKVLQMARELKEVVEGNFVAKQGVA